MNGFQFRANCHQRLFSFLVIVAALAGVGGCRKSENPGEGKSSSGSPEVSSGVGAEELEIVAHTEEKERDALQLQVRALLSKGDFAQLEALAKEFRDNKARFPGGRWKLRTFYTAFGDLPDKATESDWQDLIKQGEQWRKQYPQSPTPGIALAEMYRGHAWVARTGDFADKVTDEGWRLMGQRLQKAFQTLGQVNQLPEKCPAWHGTIMRVAVGAQLPRASYEKLFQDAVKAAPDYDAIYDYKAYYLLPRWHGEEGEWESFAIAMMKRDDVPHSKEVFARAALYLRELGYFYDEFSDTEASWNLLKESFRELEKNYPDSAEIKSIFCLMCARLWDYKEAREQFELLEGKADLSVWGSREDYLKLVNWLKFDDATLERGKQAEKAARKK